MTDEFWPWIKHDGKGCPLARGTVVEIMQLYSEMRVDFRVVEALTAGTGNGESWDWSNWPACTKILSYRVQKGSGGTLIADLFKVRPVNVKELERMV